MKCYIFLTEEGLTKTPSDLEIENLQVLGWAQGKNAEDALGHLKEEVDYLEGSDYENAIALELANEKQKFLSLR